jgi:hypothetical protein
MPSTLPAPAPATPARVVELACRAPSVHNTQPWAWRVDGDRVELYADHTRRLEVADPQGRNLLLSCGAALHHARVAAVSLGFDPVVARQPDPARPDLLATLDLVRSTREPTISGELHVLLARRTDRRRFTAWPVSEEHLQALAHGVSRREVQAVALTGIADRVRAGMLVSRAAAVQEADERYAAEERRWSERERSNLLAAPDGVIVVCTAEDTPAAWVAAGEAMSELWLRAANDGLSVVPLSQVVEVAETRRELHHDVLGGLVHPQIVLRLGWQEIGRSDLAATPRRVLEDVLLDAPRAVLPG